ncbi:MAG: hypothetical protein KBH06_01420 [Spirochaetes bacterium]|nr:hypothetical protein [Spirochaetota bacterium]
MKLYNFDRFDKFLISEEDAPIDQISKEPCLHGFSTFVIPPSIVPDGKIPVFDGEKWNIVENKFWVPSVEEKTFYSGRNYTGIPQLPIPDAFCCISLPSIPRLLNGALFGSKLSNRIRIINLHIVNIFKKHENILNPKTADHLLHSTYHTDIELVIYLIKRSIDDIITANYVKLYISDIETSHKIFIESIGDLLSTKKKNGKDEVKDCIKFNKHEKFLKTINDLHNSLKHDFFSPETDMRFGLNFPVVISIKTDHGDLNKIDYHNHSLGQLVLGFSDFLLDNVTLSKRLLDKAHNESVL